MRGSWTLVAWCLAAAAAHAGEVRVLGPTGAPVPDAASFCVLGSAPDPRFADARGLAPVSDACRRVRCEQGDYPAVEAAVRNGRAECRFVAPLVVMLGPLPAACDDERGCVARLRPLKGRDIRTSSYRPSPRDLPGKRERRIRVGRLMPGAYRLTLRAGDPPWECTTDLVELPAGTRTIAPAWREPLVVNGVVRDAKGRLREGIPVRARGAAAPDGWACAPTEREAITDRAGRFTLRVDPAETVIEAGDADDMLGTATATLPAAGAIELTLAPNRPAS